MREVAFVDSAAKATGIVLAAVAGLLVQSCADTAGRIDTADAYETAMPAALDRMLLAEEQHCLALTLYWEARGEGRPGMIAVGWTVLNRVRSRHFPASLCEVVFQGGERPPCQFSWWCDGKSDRPRDLRSWESATRIAAELLVDPPPDPTYGALFYHSTSIVAPWQRFRTARIGRHVFYR